MRRLLISIFLCFAVNIIQSQELPEYSPSSPTTAALGTFGEIPVSLSTGTPNVSIPVYTLTEGKISVPVSLDYHASGIRVKDRSGLAGVKWALNAGGQINVNDVYEPVSGVLSEGNMKFDLLEFSMSGDHEKYNFFEDNHLKYLRPESYSYHFLGKRGHVFVEGDNTLFYVPKQNKIIIENLEVENHSLGKIITDEFGITYYFNTKEVLTTAHKTENDITYINNKTYTSAFFLDKIVSPEGDEINFEYENNNYVIDYDLVNEYEYVQLPIINQNCGPIYNLGKEIYNIRSYQSKRLSRIYGTSGEIVFTYLDGIAHNDGGGQLQTIEVRNNHKQIQKYSIEYTYNGRYNISQVNIYDSNDHKISDYQVTYKEGSIPEDYNTRGIDFFGFQNGKTNNQSLVPKLLMDGVEYGEADRFADFQFSSIGIIESIKYPTGGISYFEFEPNYNSQPILLSNLDATYQHMDVQVLNTEYPPGISEIPFTIPENAIYNPNSLNNTSIVISGFGPDIINGYYTRFLSTFSIVNEATGEEAGSFNGGYTQDYGPTAEYSGTNASENGGVASQGGYSFTHYYNLPPGNYKIIMDNNLSPYQFPYEHLSDLVFFSVQWKEPNEPNEDTEYEIGGHRIKSITHTDANGVVTSQKEYEYENGQVFYNPNFVAAKKLLYCGDILLKCLYYKISSSPVHTVGLNSSGFMAYEKVIERQPGNGAVEYLFDVSKAMGYPGLPNYNSPFHVRGYKLNRVLEKRYLSENQELLKKEVITYPSNSPGTNDYIHGMQAGRATLFADNDLYFKYFDPAYDIFFCEEGGHLANDYSYSVYTIESSYIEPKSKTVITYQDNAEVSVLEEYFYDETYYLLKETKTTDNHNRTVYEKNYFPADQGQLSGLGVLEAAAITELTNQHRIAEPIQTETYKVDTLGNETLLSAQRTLYNDFNGLILPEKVQTSKNTDALEDRIIYTHYDDFGHPLELMKANGTHISYIWGYGQSQPIAKLEAISYSEIAPAAIANLQTLSDNDTDALSEQSLRNALNALRNSHPDAVITSFTYDPLIGMTSMTDPGGRTYFYTYDDFNRLAVTEDIHSDIMESYNYNYAQETPPVYVPLNAGIDYGSHTNDYQWFAANLDGGSGNFSYAWFEGVDDSSTSFEASASGTNDTYQFMVSCGQLRYVKLVVTDTTTGEIVEAVKANNNSCDYPPLNAAIGYGADHNDFQWFISTVSGGSGNYSYAWYEGIGSSNVDFANTPLGTAPSYQLFIPCTTYKYVKLVVTDTVTGLTVSKIKNSDNFPCSGGNGGGGNPGQPMEEPANNNGQEQ